MADQPLTSRGAATYQRILDVATREFAQHGIAGARVERIVAAARTNKAQLYAYFGNKEKLFNAMSMAWSPVSNVYAATDQEPSDVHEQRRALLRESVRRAVAAA